MIRRIFRIYPLSVLAVLAIVLFHLPLGSLGAMIFQSVAVTPLGLVSNLLLTQNLTNTQSVLGPLWSLPFEMQMYFVLPVLFLVCLRTKSVSLLASLWAFAAVIGWVGLRFGHLPDIVRYVPCFLPGVIAYKLGDRTRARLPFHLFPLFLLTMALTLMYANSLAAGWFICLLIGVAIPQFIIMESRWLRRASHAIAKYSYGIYLGHYFCMWFALYRLRHLPWEAQWVVLAASLVLLPVLFFHLVEQPMINLGGRVVDELFGRRYLIPGGSERLEARVP